MKFSVGNILVGTVNYNGIYNTFYKVVKVTAKTITLAECDKQSTYNGFGGQNWTTGQLIAGRKSFSLRTDKPYLRKGYQLIKKTEPFEKHEWLCD